MSELLALFERQVRYVQERPDDRLLTALPSFVAMVEEEPRLNAVADDLDRELRRASETFAETEALLRAQLAAAWEEHAWFRGLLGGANSPESSEESPFEMYGGIDRFAESLAARATIPEHPAYVEATNDPTPLGAALKQLWHWLRWFEDDVGDHHPAYRELFGEYHRISAHHERALARRNLLDSRSAAAAWWRVRRFADAVLPLASPSSASDDVDALLATWVERYPHNLVAALAASKPPRGDLEEQSHARTVTQVRTDLETFSAEMAHRIGLRLSHAALMQRFKTRCQKYDAADLRHAFEAARASNRVPEDVLTRSAARYLFDQGLDPLFSAEVVSLRPDLFDTSTTTPLYVEAKWYDSAPRSMMEKAAWQVWSTWNDVFGAHDVREAFLLVFRLRGPLVTVPEVVRHNGVSIFPLVVDIGPNKPEPGEKDGRGSRSGVQPVHLDESFFLPGDT